MDRKPIVAGQFYTADPAELAREVAGYMGGAKAPAQEPTLLAMAPHAGYVFSGPVAGMTLGAANLAPTVLLLGPNHTGRGHAQAVWPEGNWLAPGGGLPVDAALAAALLASAPDMAADTGAHLGEHSLEVLVPFLMAAGVRAMVPVAVADLRFEALERTGRAVASVIRKRGEPVSIVVSSDMSHYVSAERAKELDTLALDAALALDPARLYDTVRREHITMCGVLPMTLGLVAAKALGATRAELAAYDNSGRASGDHQRVVGYAGLLVS